MDKIITASYENAAGFLAERLARRHFERLGYSVQPFGIEHLISAQIRNVIYNKTKKSPHLNNETIRFFRYLPDFFISREKIDDTSGSQPMLLLLEANYRENVQLDNRKDLCEDTHKDSKDVFFEKCHHQFALHFRSGKTLSHHTCLGCEYRHIIEMGMPRKANGTGSSNVLFYLMAEHITLADDPERKIEAKIFLNLAYSPHWWYLPEDRNGFKTYPMYQGLGTDFETEAAAITAEFNVYIAELRKQYG